MVGSYQWIYGPKPTEFFAAQALTGITAVYTSAGGSVPVDQSGTPGGTLNSSSLSVDFTRQAVSAAVSATVGPSAWIGTATDIRLDGTSFFASTAVSNSHNFMTVTRNAAPAFGSLAGSLMGSALQGGGFAYAFNDGSANSVTGSAAFTGASQSTSPSFVPAVYVTGKSFANYPPTGTTVGSIDSTFAYGVEAGVVASTRITKDGSNAIVGFDGQLPVVTGASVSNKPVAYGAADGPFDAPPTPGAPVPTKTTVIDKGTDAITGITWGRYSGLIKFTDRISGTSSGATTHINASCATPALGCLDQWHVMFGPAGTAVPLLPVSGTINYTFAGGTMPTNSLGQAAASAPTAQLSANFTTNMVGFAVPTFTVGSNTWSATTAGGTAAPSVPIQQNAFFNGPLNVTTDLVGVTAGKVTGVFTGNHTIANPAGQAGVMVGFSLNSGGITGTTVSGASAFRKP